VSFTLTGMGQGTMDNLIENVQTEMDYQIKILFSTQYLKKKLK